MGKGSISGSAPIPGRSWFDAYSLKAEWAPVLTVAAPAFLAVYALVPSVASLAGATAVMVGLPPVLAQQARDLGKALEPGLWASCGGKPTTRFLRHRDRTIAEPTKARYFKTLAAAGIVRPTVEGEEAHPDGADVQYESAGDWLRRHVLNSPRKSLVAPKLGSYGLARNLLGVRWIGLFVASAASATDLIAAVRAHTATGMMPTTIIAAAMVALGLAVMWSCLVTRGRVCSAADAYALALLECCEPDGRSSTAGAGSVGKEGIATGGRRQKGRKKNPIETAPPTPTGA